MFRNVFITTCLSIFVLGFVLFHCQLPAPPAGPDESNIEVFLKSADGKTTGIEINDTIGNQIQIRLIFSLTNYIDSAKIEILTGQTLEKEIPCRYKKEQYDTVYVPYSFSTPGTRTIKVTGYIKDYDNIVSMVTIHVIDRSSTIQNHRPVVVVPETQIVGVGQTVSFPVSATDPDAGQQVTIKVINKPDSATFLVDTFKWTPLPMDTGTIKILFIARDNGLPVMSDTHSVVITINSKPVNRAPSWNPRKVQRSGLPGTLFSYDLKDKCFDPDNDSLTLSLVSAPPTRDTLIGNVYSFTPPVSDTGKQTIHIIAKDPSGLSDTFTLELIVSNTIITVPDKVPPVITFHSPLKDTIIIADSFDVKVSCVDDSGISSVKGFRDATAFDLKTVASSANLWTGKIRGLPAGSYSTIKIVAADSSAAKNSDSLSIRIKYDADTTKPTISRVVPAGDSTSTNSSSYTITLNSNDASGIASVKATLGSKSFTGSKGQGDSWTVTITDLVPNSVNSIITAVIDSSLRKNTKSLTFYIKYDPTMLDTIGPAIIQKSGPVSSTIITKPLVTIVDSLFDPSGIDSAYWRLNNGPAKIMVRAGGKYSLTDSIKQEGFDTIVVTVTDSASRHNISKQVFMVNYLIPPVITVQPVSKIVCAGTPADFSVTASGSAPLSYQWRSGAVNPVNINNATSPTYSPSTASAGQTILTCLVINGSGIDAVSNLCTLTVNVSPSKPSVQNRSVTICSGSSTNLITTNTPSSGTTWYWYTTRNPSSVSQAISTLTVSPTSNTTYYVRGETNSTCGNSEWDSIVVTVNEIPNKPTPVNRTIAICSGNSTSLSTTGLPPTGVAWRWYTVKNPVSANDAISSLAVSPTSSSTYYVRGESVTCGNSQWDSILVTVNYQATQPTLGSSSSSICSGGQVTLNITAGNPGTNGIWTWYKDNTWSSQAKVGTGIPIDVYPTATTTYYVRSEGSTCSNSASNGSIAVSVNTRSIAPTNITSTSNPVCPGEPVTLTVTDGTLGTNALWHWYTNSGCTVAATGTTGGTNGSKLTVTITSQTTYYVRAEGGCNGNAGTANTTISIVTPITFTANPASVTQCNLNWAQFSTIAAGGGTGQLNYQWKKDGVAISDGTNYKNSKTRTLDVLTSVYTIGNYTCIVDNGNGCNKTSESATLSIEYSPLTVYPPNPSSWTGCEGGFLGFDVAVEGGSGNYIYQWYKDDIELTPDATRSLDPTQRSIYITSVKKSDEGRYNCRVNDRDNLGCIAASGYAPVTVTNPCP